MINLNPTDDSVLSTALKNLLPGILPDWLDTRRWFADKGRGRTTVETEDLLVDRVGADWIALAIVRLWFPEREDARYFLPLALVAVPRNATAIGEFALGNERWVIVDASEAAWFGNWFLDRLAGVGSVMPERWAFTSDAGAASVIAAARSQPAKPMGGEQSNSSLRYGAAMIVKVIRRLAPGPNPDEEVLRVLAETGFPRVPRYVGAASWQAEPGVEYPIALAQAFVPNEGDGWLWMLDRLAAVAAGEREPDLDDLEPERRLGQRTAEMHRALSEAPPSDFAPVTPDQASIAADVQRVHDAAGHTAALLRERQDDLPPPPRARLDAILSALQDAVIQAEGFRDESGTRRIRVHGDYHLGQTLRTPDGDWTIVDFEGEPARPAAERRQKHSVLKDVAGMLRSFAYARGVAERTARDDGVSGADARLARWEARARAAFLAGYGAAIAGASIPLVPPDAPAFQRALAAWELDKALYEIAYEARYRPDWIELPLRALLPGP